MHATASWQGFSVDVGIDLGTTNSAIAACVEGKINVLRNIHNQELTPSAVRIRPNGAIDVGQIAYQRLAVNPEEVAVEFKRWIESDKLFRFPSGKEMSPVELSAEVLKSLLQTAELRLGRRPAAAVITVPAAFDLSQCARTEEAARLAGLSHTVLLQEPIAASLAYGFSADVREGSWLVFDLGGGTLDVAVVGVRDGRIEVFDHEGDNFLGGKDLDWIIVEKLILPKLSSRYALHSWRRENHDRRLELALLKHLAEDAKIRLSSAEEVTVTIESGHVALIDDEGQEISADVVIRRAELEEHCQDWVEQAIGVTRTVMDRNAGVKPGSVLFVGGPTNMPIVRTRIQEVLGLDVVAGPNPMLAVAEGAALFAASQVLPSELRQRPQGRAPEGEHLRESQVVVSHVNVTDDDEAPVGVRLTDGRASYVEIVAADGSWQSGKLPLNAEGGAVVPVALLRKGQNEFRVQAYTSEGATLPLAGETFVITKGLVAAPPPLSRSIGVVVVDPLGAGRHVVEWLVRKGTPLPTRATYEFRTTIALEPGGDVEVIAVYLVEGESRRPERNRLVGRIDITDRDVERALPAGSPLEIRLDISESRLMTASVYLPVTDQSFRIAINLEVEQQAPSQLARDLMEAQRRYEESLPVLSSGDAQVLARQLDETASLVRSASADDPDALRKSVVALKAINAKLDEVDVQTQHDQALREADEVTDQLRDIARELGTQDDRQRADDLLSRLRTARHSGDVEEVERITALMQRLNFEILVRHDWVWKEWFEEMATSGGPWTDRSEADALIREGRLAVQRNDGDALRRATLGLFRLRVRDDGGMPFTNVGIRRR